jgi:hypothetical protein
MGNEWTALQRFWSNFGLNAYDENTVPDDAPLPHITYESAVADFDSKIPLTASLWYRSTSWAEISEKAHEISCFIGGGVGVPYEHGRLWIVKESPFAQRMGEPTDDKIRRIVLQISAEYQ